MHVHWLGKNLEYAAEKPIEGWDRLAPTEPLEAWGNEASPSQTKKKKQSVALAVLGILGAIAELFGMIVVELEAEDNGSGKLIELYLGLGFNIVENSTKNSPMMEAPIKKIVDLAPAEWFSSIVPPDFDAWGWLQSDLRYNQVERILLGNDVPWRWSWKASWPLGAAVDARLQLGDGFNRISTEAFFKTKHGVELAFARGTVRLRQGSLRVLWLGRKGSRPVHPSVQGQLAYSDAKKSWGSDGSQDGTTGPNDAKNITAAMALLGVLAALARWFGVQTTELTALDDGSGKLIAYLRSFGFVEHPGQPVKTELGDPLVLTASCEYLAKRCCPPEWRTELPRASELSMLAKLCPKD